MPANHKVSVAWQIVATFVPIANFWAFYRIRKLRKYLLYVFLPSVVLTIVILAYPRIIKFDETIMPELIAPDEPGYPYDFVTPGTVASIIASIIGWALQGFAIYLVIVWSRQHNNRVDASPGQAPQ